MNEIVGTGQFPQQHDGVYVVEPGGVVQIVSSAGVNWTVTEDESLPASSARPFSRSGVGDAVFDLPLRDSNSIYQIRASYPGNASNFIVYVGPRLVVNEIIGTATTLPTFDGAYVLPFGARVQIVNSSGVSWSFVER